MVNDPARAEELAVEVFWKLWRNPTVHGDGAAGWLYRTALDELRRAARRLRYQRLFGLAGLAPSPEEIRAANEEQGRVRMALGALDSRSAKLLLLRTEDLPGR